MESLRHRKPKAVIAAALSLTALTGCSIESYLTNPSNVQCDGTRTESTLRGNGNVVFIVHGKSKGAVATIHLRRNDQGVSVEVSGDITGPPQQLEADGYTKPVPIESSPEISAFGAGGAWVIDVQNDNAIIQGTCEGM